MPAKLLIADDSSTIQKVFERTFPSEEFTLKFANNGEEALTKARADKPNVIIADINMPAKNGFELCEELKRDPVLKSTPVLLLIGILDDFDEDEGRRVGADGFIIKPFESNAAINKVREALAKGGSDLPAGGAEAGGAEKQVDLTNLAQKPAATPPTEKKAANEIDVADLTVEPTAQQPQPTKKMGAEDILNVADILDEPTTTPAPHRGKTEEVMDLSGIATEPTTQQPQPTPKKGAEDILDLTDIFEETPESPTPPPPQEKAEEIMELTDITEEPTTASPPSKKATEDIFELPDIAEETPSTPPSQDKEDGNIFELSDVELEHHTTPPSAPPQQKQEGEEGFILQTSLRDLEEELKAEFPDEKAGLEQDVEPEPKMEFPEEQLEIKEDLSPQITEEGFGTLELDLPFDDTESEPRAKDADWTTLFGDLGLNESGEEAQNERLGSILDESTSELEKIEGLGTPKQDKSDEESFANKFKEPFFGENSLEPETNDAASTLKEEGIEEEFAEQFMDDFEPVFEPSEDLQDIVVREQDTNMSPSEGGGDLAEEVASRVGHELQEVVEKMIKNKVPQLVRQEIDRLKKE